MGDFVDLPEDAAVDDHARYDRATFAFETKDYVRAATLLEPLAEAEPGNAQVRLLLARSYYHAARLGRAETELRAMIERSSVSAVAQASQSGPVNRAMATSRSVPNRVSARSSITRRSAFFSSR